MNYHETMLLNVLERVQGNDKKEIVRERKEL